MKNAILILVIGLVSSPVWAEPTDSDCITSIDSGSTLTLDESFNLPVVNSNHVYTMKNGQETLPSDVNVAFLKHGIVSHDDNSYYPEVKDMSCLIAVGNKDGSEIGRDIEIPKGKPLTFLAEENHNFLRHLSTPSGETVLIMCTRYTTIGDLKDAFKGIATLKLAPPVIIH